jgi:hypothetical protein
VRQGTRSRGKRAAERRPVFISTPPPILSWTAGSTAESAAVRLHHRRSGSTFVLHWEVRFAPVAWAQTKRGAAYPRPLSLILMPGPAPRVGGDGPDEIFSLVAGERYPVSGNRAIRKTRAGERGYASIEFQTN